MDVRITKPRNDDHVGGIDLYYISTGAQTGTDTCYLVAFDQNVATGKISDGRIHADDCASLQHYSPIAIRIGSLEPATEHPVSSRCRCGLTETCRCKRADAGCACGKNLATRSSVSVEEFAR